MREVEVLHRHERLLCWAEWGSAAGDWQPLCHQRLACLETARGTPFLAATIVHPHMAVPRQDGEQGIAQVLILSAVSTAA